MVPDLVEESAVKSEMAIEPARLEADLISGDRIGLERPILRLAVVAAGSEAGRIGEIDHLVAVWLPRQVDLMRLAALLVDLVDVLAGKLACRRTEANRGIGVRCEAREASQRVACLEAANAAGERQARHDVVGQLAEYGVIA